MAELKLYYDGISQPGRSVKLLLDANKVEYQTCRLNVLKGETKSNPEFLKVSASKAIPAIDDNGFCLLESVAIMKYIISKHNLPDHWYPSDLQQRAKIDEYLFWHASNTRRGFAIYLYLKYIGKKSFGIQADPKLLEQLQQTQQSTLDMFENHFLKETNFINSSEISIADIFAVCEFTQFWVTDEDIVANRPKISKWLQDVQSALSPHFDEAHEVIYGYQKDGNFK